MSWHQELGARNAFLVVFGVIFVFAVGGLLSNLGSRKALPPLTSPEWSLNTALISQPTEDVRAASLTAQSADAYVSYALQHAPRGRFRFEATLSAEEATNVALFLVTENGELFKRRDALIDATPRTFGVSARYDGASPIHLQIGGAGSVSDGEPIHVGDVADGEAFAV